MTILVTIKFYRKVLIMELFELDAIRALQTLALKARTVYEDRNWLKTVKILILLQ
jgi:hypothetical protein